LRPRSCYGVADGDGEADGDPSPDGEGVGLALFFLLEVLCVDFFLVVLLVVSFFCALAAADSLVVVIVSCLLAQAAKNPMASKVVMDVIRIRFIGYVAEEWRECSVRSTITRK
jgi:hypothetical protein